MNSSPPNILFIQVDQLAAAMLGCYGNPIADTPNLTRLAQCGTVFDSAYTNFPLCAPSRFSMMSGQLSSVIGAYDNGAEFPASIPTFAHYLRAIGYQTCLVGKMHFVGPDQLHGFEQRLTTDIYPADFGWTGDWTEIKQRHSNDIRTFTHAGICVRNPQIEYDDEVTHRTCRKIYDLARQRDQRPFFLMASFTHPHDPYQCTDEYWRRYDHEQIDMPKVETITESAQDPYSARLRHQYGLDQFEPDRRQIRVARHAYYGSVSYVDDQVGHILSSLRETGLDHNTAIVFTSDHGDMLGERGLWYKKSFFEHSARVPLIFSVPGVSPRQVCRHVSLVDLLPTFVELAAGGEAFPLVDEIEGRSLLASISGADDHGDSTVYSENLAEGAMEPILMVRNGRFKYVCSGADPDQLFDLEQDPLELHNLAGDPSSGDVIDELKALVNRKWDIAGLSCKVRLSQKRRLFLSSVLATGASSAWDYQPEDQAGNQVLRADRSYNDWAYNDIVGFRKP